MKNYILLKLDNMTLKYPLNIILVTIEKKYQDTERGLLIDTTYHPEEYATLKGIVHSVPDKVGNEYWRRKTNMIIRPGDEIWFSYSIIYNYTRLENGETPTYKNLIVYEGVEYWKVDYAEVFCVVRDGKIIMPYEYVLLEPLKDNRDLRSSSGLVLGTNETFNDRALVKALPDIEMDCKVGDMIPVEERYVQQYQMLGGLHFIIPSRRLIAKF